MPNTPEPTTALLLTINGRAIHPADVKSLFVGIRSGHPITISIDYVEHNDVARTGVLSETVWKGGKAIGVPPQLSHPKVNAVLPRTFIGKETIALTPEHIEELKTLRMARGVTIYDEVPKHIKEPPAGTTYQILPIEITTKEYDITTWDDMKLLIGKLVQTELWQEKKFDVLVQASPPIGVNAGDSTAVCLTEKLSGYTKTEKPLE